MLVLEEVGLDLAGVFGIDFWGLFCVSDVWFL